MNTGNLFQCMPIENICESKVIKSRTLPECISENAYHDGRDGVLVAKVPVLIAEPKIQIDVEAEIKLNEPALDIKRINKNVFITQCKLFQSDDSMKGKLFLGGFVRKNIEYSTVTGMCGNNFSLCGNIRHTTVKVPFECVTMVEYICPPEIYTSGPTEKIEFFSKNYDGCMPCEDKIMGNDPCEQGFVNYEYFSEKVFCELVEAKVVEKDIRKNPEFLLQQIPSEQLFDCMVEKMVITLRLKLLQKQQIKVPAKNSCCGNKEPNYNFNRYSRFRK